MAIFNPYKSPFEMNKINEIFDSDYSINTLKIKEDFFNDDHRNFSDSLIEKMKNQISIQIAKDIDAELIKQITSAMKPIETEEEKVIKLLKGDFEKKTGITFERFIEVYNSILENNPEKLI